MLMYINFKFNFFTKWEISLIFFKLLKNTNVLIKTFHQPFSLRLEFVNSSRNENVLKLPRHGVYDILKVKSHKKVGVTELVKKI